MKIVNRDAMEAHLTLDGWIPASYGTIGARKGNIVHYMFRPSPKLDGKEFSFGHSLLPDSQIARHDTGMWYWSDELFWAFARHLQTDAVRIKTESVNENFR
jgi:hypothetical protein